jgi:hypothetical protein
MPWSEKQHRYFEAVAHGDSDEDGDLSREEAQKLADEGVKRASLSEPATGCEADGRNKDERGEGVKKESAKSGFVDLTPVFYPSRPS